MELWHASSTWTIQLKINDMVKPLKVKTRVFRTIVLFLRESHEKKAAQKFIAELIVMIWKFMKLWNVQTMCDNPSW